MSETTIWLPISEMPDDLHLRDCRVWLWRSGEGGIRGYVERPYPGGGYYEDWHASTFWYPDKEAALSGTWSCWAVAPAPPE